MKPFTEQELKNEKWLPCDIDTRYEISNLGRIKRIKPARGTRINRILKSTPNHKTQYHYVMFALNGKYKLHAVHQLVCRVFHGDAPSAKHEPNHLDFDRSNNRANNLEWRTRKDNLHHSKLQGRDNSGSRNGRAKLSEQDVIQIRQLLSQGVKGIALSKQFNVSCTQISKIKNYKKWSGGAWLPHLDAN